MQSLDEERMKVCVIRNAIYFNTSTLWNYALAFSSLAACSLSFFLISSTLSTKAPAFCALICGDSVSDAASCKSAQNVTRDLPS